MRAIILAGGEGTRLRPLTQHTPKQLVPVLGRPLLERLLRHLRGHRITRITLALTRSAGGEAVRAAFGDGHSLGVELAYAYEETPLGSGGAIAAAAAGWDEPFLVCNGDIVTDVDLGAMMRAHTEREAELTIFLHEVDDPSAFGAVDLASDGRIRRFVEKPAPGTEPSRLINAGAWLFEPSLLREMDAERFNRVEDGLFPALASGGRGIFGFHARCYWRDVGNPAAYLAANLELLEASAEPAGQLGAGTHVDAAARVRRSVTGERCNIAAGAVVEESVLWDGVRVEAGATVLRSVLATGVMVRSGARLDGAVVAHGATIGAGERLEAGATVEADVRYAAAGAR